MPAILDATPVLHAPDLTPVLEWYKTHLGVSYWTFPENPPFSFGCVQLSESVQLFYSQGPTVHLSGESTWATYLRVSDVQGWYAHLKERVKVVQPLARMFYGDVEFVVADPVGYHLVFSELLPPEVEVPLYQETAT